MNPTRKLTAVALTLALLAGCAGRSANPVMVSKHGDRERSCASLLDEMTTIEQEIQRLVPESKKAGKNVALGVAGAFFIVPWLFMDLSQAEREEINAYRQRYNHLSHIAADKGCK